MPLADVIDAKSMDELLVTLAERRSVAVSYSSPEHQLSYMEKVLGISVDDDLKWNWREIKATRDVVLHNASIVNEIYLQKSGNYSRAPLGKKLAVDEEYFETSAIRMKSLIGGITSRVQRSLKEVGNNK